MFCRSCGTQNADGSPSCISCGQPLNNPYQAGAVQPPGAPMPGQQPMHGKPDNYLVQSILVTLCCCLPIGIAGIVFAAQVDSKWNAGDTAGAMSSAANAKKFTLIGFGLGLVLNLLVLGLQVLLGIGAANQGGGF